MKQFASTQILRGVASSIGAPKTHVSAGALARLSTTKIVEPIDYRQHSERHTFNLVLEHESGSRGAADPVGRMSFSPAGRERRRSVSCGVIVGFELALDDEFVREACEYSGAWRWNSADDVVDRKAQLSAASIAKLMTQPRDALLLDTMLVVMARQIGGAFGGAQKRRDDGWLHPAALARVVERLRADPGNPPRLAQMAEDAGLGASAFIRGFRGAIGVTPAAFAMRVRLTQAEAMLLASDAPLSVIADKCGFVSAAHFIRAFRHRSGVTPGQWRRSRG